MNKHAPDLPPTLDQQRAKYAWEKVEEAARQGCIKEYTNLAKSTASLVMNSGLMQTLAFLQSKSQPEHKLLRKDLRRWLGRTFGGTRLENSESFPKEEGCQFEKVMDALYQSPPNIYMRANSEIMALFRWLRQLADARKSIDPQNSTEGTGG